MCGDIGNPLFPNYEEFLGQMSSQFIEVFLISGNHEYYHVTSSKNKYTMNEIDSIIENICKRFPNIHYLNNKSIELKPNITVAGTTLWSQIFENHEMIMKYHNDYRLIHTTTDKLLSINDTNKMNEKNRQWLESEIEKAQLHNRKLIIISHHMPSYCLIDKKYQNNWSNSAFSNHLDHLIKPPVVAWLYGHSHNYHHTIINNVYCGINAVGYMEENTGYNTNETFEIES